MLREKIVASSPRERIWRKSRPPVNDQAAKLFSSETPDPTAGKADSAIAVAFLHQARIAIRTYLGYVIAHRSRNQSSGNMKLFPLFIGIVSSIQIALVYSEETGIERCEVLPLPEHQVSLQVDGEEKTRWHFGKEYPRPFFYPFLGPSGSALTRMGHPGAQNHDHHRSIWFAHHDVNGLSFWSDQNENQIRQKHWYAYRDGETEAVMASVTGWFDPNGIELMEQDLVAALRPGTGGETFLEFQITMRPGAGQEKVELGKTNFGLLAVRVAKSLSVHFGGGVLTNSEGKVGEPEIFGEPARWMDYSGPVAAGTGENRKTVTEGITYFDHPDNPRYPSRWHVRSDGWMGSSFCMEEGFTITPENPLTLRYLLHAHGGEYDAETAEKVALDFARQARFEIGKSERPHRQFDVWRSEEDVPE